MPANIFSDIEGKGELTPEQEKSIIEKYEFEGEKALNFVKQGNVFKVNDEVFIKGRQGLYKVDPKNRKCNCTAVYQEVGLGVSASKDGDRKKLEMEAKDKKCSHILAAKIAKAADKISKVPSKDRLDNYFNTTP
ncbi:hypothetical protein AKJ51_04295 [candidate division MSBL1 archaeon SCGC-AAA382A20]|uniref:SWIM-type domain-containing protein n=1 Tax=candidate division MSBL1 archaeon SCGC-AAA382A20 TaxID=1698280 RepID=A0A133VHY3_9EURY|nr:hypothetical protein AKJ51_04295 [candidate division MSBL1 archaeon SCGC-AAA382A20]